ncbi:MAG: acyltransferase [Chthonomonadaceae bacterium]|nr:acyltransferase [Chthonomonadaceae bacterium]
MTEIEPSQSKSALDPTPQQRPQLHLAYLDGIRGMAALFVVIHHAFMEIDLTALPRLLQRPLFWLAYGQVAVDVFIVLSGYCLMLPVVRSGGVLKGGTQRFFLRRCKRILPPYYVALALFLILIALVPGMNQKTGVRWDVALPAFTPGALISHLFLVHNLKTNWLHAIDPPMWSIATEFQIYLIFPFILIPLWKRCGNLVTILASCGGGLMLSHFIPLFAGACFWLTGLFAMGMAAASLNFTPNRKKPLAPEPLLAISIIIFITCGLILRKHLPGLVIELIIGIATAALLVGCTEWIKQKKDRKNPIINLLESKIAVALGSFSYSLYLIHFPILSLLHLWLRPYALPESTVFAILALFGTALSIGISYLFYLLVERHFIPSRSS